MLLSVQFGFGGLGSRFDATGQMAALGGFASKDGLASAPVFTAWLPGEDNYPLIIWISAVAMILILIPLLVPARLHVRKLKAAPGLDEMAEAGVR